MTKRSSFVAALVVLAIASIGIGAATQLALQNDGIKFPDNTVQKTAAETPGIFVQGAVTVNINDTEECKTVAIYTVAAGKRLRIEWISVEASEFGSAAYDPIDINVKTWLGGVQRSHFLDRLDGAEFIGSSLVGTVRWSSPVTLYSQGNKNVEVFACRNSSTDTTSVDVRFHGQLFNE